MGQINTGIMLKLIETDNINSVNFKKGQYIIVNNAQMYYDPTTGNDLNDRVCLNPKQEIDIFERTDNHTDQYYLDLCTKPVIGDLVIIKDRINNTNKYYYTIYTYNNNTEDTSLQNWCKLGESIPTSNVFFDVNVDEETNLKVIDAAGKPISEILTNLLKGSEGSGLKILTSIEEINDFESYASEYPVVAFRLDESQNNLPTNGIIISQKPIINEDEQWGRFTQLMLPVYDNNYINSRYIFRVCVREYYGDEGWIEINSWEDETYVQIESSDINGYITGSQIEPRSISEEHLDDNTIEYRHLNNDLKNTLKQTDKTKRSLDYLWKKSKGIIYDTEVVNTVSHTNEVPSGAMEYAELQMMGGHSIYYNQWIKPFSETWKDNNLNTTFLYEYNSNTHTAKFTNIHSSSYYIGFNIATKIKANHKYYVKFDVSSISGFAADNYKFISPLNNPVIKFPENSSYVIFTASNDGRSFDLGVESKNTILEKNIAYFECSKAYFMDLTQLFGAGNEPNTEEELIAAFPEDAYRYYSPGQSFPANIYQICTYSSDHQDKQQLDIPDEIMRISGYGEGFGESFNYIDFVDKKFYRVGEWKSNGEWIIYDEPTVIDISTILSDDFNVIEVEAGGTIIFYSEYGSSIPNQIEYMINVEEVQS